jgi:hypothetical protein
MDKSATSKFDDLLDRMQTSAARKGMEAAFHATPEALGRAAAKAAQLRSNSLRSAGSGSHSVRG